MPGSIIEVQSQRYHPRSSIVIAVTSPKSLPLPLPLLLLLQLLVVLSAISRFPSTESFAAATAHHRGPPSSSLSSSSLYSIHPADAMKNTIIIGLNPALQKRFILSPNTNILIPGNVHRASHVQKGIGGKGQDVYVALSCLLLEDDDEGGDRDSDSDDKDEGDDNRNLTLPYLAQFVGQGGEGDAVLQMLHKLYHKNDSSDLDDDDDDDAILSALTIRTDVKLRTCTTIIAQDSATELVEPSGIITSQEIDQLKERFQQWATRNRSGQEGDSYISLCIMGSMPPGCPTTLYGDLYDAVANAATSTTTTENGDTSKSESAQVQASTSTSTSTSTCCVIDTVVGLDHLFQQMKKHKEKQPQAQGQEKRQWQEQGGNTSKSNINMLKVNLAELKRLADVRDKDDQEATIASKEDVQNIVDQFLKHTQYTFAAIDALDYIAITNGSHDAYLACIRNRDEDKQAQGTSRINICRLTVPNLHTTTSGTNTNVTSETESKSNTTLYPIGAGDAVAAGTLAAWSHLQQDYKNRSSVNAGIGGTSTQIDNNSSSPPTIGTGTGTGTSMSLSKEAKSALMAKTAALNDDDDVNVNSNEDKAAIAAFAFGIACGSASCLKEENSVFDVKNVLSLFHQIVVD